MTEHPVSGAANESLPSASAMFASFSSTRRLLHLRVTSALLFCGLVLGFGGFGFDVLIEEGVIGEKVWATNLQLSWSTGMFAFLLAVQPTFTRTVRMASLVFVIFLNLGVVNAVANVLPLAMRPPSDWVQQDLLYWLTLLIFLLASNVYVMKTIRYDFGRRRFCMPCRLSLRHLWVVARFTAVQSAALLGISALANGLLLASSCTKPAVDGNVSAPQLNSSACHDDIASDQLSPLNHVLIATWWLILAISTTPSRRGQFLHVLGRLLLSGDAQSAATIASMLPGGRSATAVFRTAQEKFRALPFEAIAVEDLKSNADTGLHLKTHSAQLDDESVSAFMSHSWRDAADPKHETLSRWAREYKKVKGMLPTLWLE